MPILLNSTVNPSHLTAVDNRDVASPNSSGSTPHAGTDTFVRGASNTPNNRAPILAGPTAPADLNRHASSVKSSRIPELSPEVHAQLVALSNPDTVTDIEDFAARVEEISRIFISANDPRGAFPALYKVITHRAHASINRRTLHRQCMGI